MRSIGFVDNLTKSWEVFKREPGMALAGYGIWLAIAYVASFFICIGWIAWFFVLQFPFTAGMMIYYLRMAHGEKADINEIFAPVRDLGKWMCVGWLYMLINIGAMIPMIGAIGISAAVIYPAYQTVSSGNTGASVLLVVAIVLMLLTGVAISTALSLFLAVRYMFVWFTAAAGADTMEAFRLSAQLTEGVRWKLLLVYAGYMALMMVGSMVMGVGSILACILYLIGIALIYEDLTNPVPSI